jgi:hypothetical protein
MHQNRHAIETRVSIVTLGVQAVSVVLLRHLPEHHLDRGPEHPPPSARLARGRSGAGHLTPPSSSPLGAARVEWAVWARFIWRFVLALFAAALAFVVLAVAMGYA